MSRNSITPSRAAFTLGVEVLTTMPSETWVLQPMTSFGDIMMMGLPSSYWFQFLQEQRGATILDVMRNQGYQMQFYTSALFSYPEFDKTIFEPEITVGKNILPMERN